MTTIWSGPVGRRALTKQFGAAAMDQANVHWSCSACGAALVDTTLYAIGSIVYRDFSGLRDYSKVARGLADVSSFGAKASACCGNKPVVRAADYHAYQSDRDRDLVLRWKPDATTPELFFWEGDAFSPTDSPFDAQYDEHDEFATEILLRRAASRMETEGVEAALDDIKQCAVDCEPYWEMLFFVQPLANAGHAKLAAEIIEEFFSYNADDDDEEMQSHVERARQLLAELDTD